MKGTFKGIDHMQSERIICSHAIMLSLEGIPAIYIHSILGTTNDYESLKSTNNKRSINRKSWQYEEIDKLLTDPNSQNYKIYKELIKLIDIRKNQSAFHPNATQFTLNLGSSILALWRQSLDRKQSIFAINNISNQKIFIQLCLASRI